MLKQIQSKIQKFEKEKQIKQDKISKIKLEIDEVDSKLKKLYSFKKEYEKLETNTTEFLNSLK